MATDIAFHENTSLLPFSSSGWETSRLNHNLTENGIGQAETPDCAGRIQLTCFQFDRDPAPTRLTHVLAS